jgi:hypothetical protein
MLTRDAILTAQDLKTTEVDVPEWGGSVAVRMMTGTERDAFGESLRKPDGTFDGTNYRAKLLAKCVVDEAGKPLFSDADIEVLNAKSSAAIDRVFKVADTLNTMGAEAIEAAEKN